MVTDQKEKEALLASCEGRKIDLNDRQACDVEVLCVGGFSPLEGFMNEDAYNSVVENARLPGERPYEFIAQMLTTTFRSRNMVQPHSLQASSVQHLTAHSVHLVSTTCLKAPRSVSSTPPFMSSSCSACGRSINILAWAHTP